MTKSEILEALEKGYRVTHRFFSPDEFIQLENESYLTEEGYLLSPEEFWKYRVSHFWNDGWSIYKQEFKGKPEEEKQ